MTSPNICNNHNHHMNIHYYQTNHGVFFKFVAPANYYHAPSITSLTSIDGVNISDIEPTANTMWYRFSTVPKIGIGKGILESKLIEYRLRNPALACDKIPLVIDPMEIIKEWDEYEECTVWQGKFAGLHGLYEEVIELVQSPGAEIPFVATCLGNLNIDDLTTPSTMRIKLQDSAWSGSTRTVEHALADIVNYADFESILTPEFLIHQRPCSLTSKQVYGIIRSWVKSNIDNHHAAITSDYDFCFTVKKRVSLAPSFAPLPVGMRKNSRASKPAESLVEVFEMTYAGYKGTGGYDGYTCISPWRADNLQELADLVKTNLESLMTMINQPAHQCDACAGNGVIVRKTHTCV